MLRLTVTLNTILIVINSAIMVFLITVIDSKAQSTLVLDGNKQNGNNSVMKIQIT